MSKKREYDAKWYGSIWDNLKVEKPDGKYNNETYFYFQIGEERTQITKVQAMKLAMFLLMGITNEVPNNALIEANGKIKRFVGSGRLVD